MRQTDAHATDRLAEMVCSNSFRSDNPTNAVGLLKREMESIGSVILEEARKAAVPAGDALAVDRAVFAEGVTRRIAGIPAIEIVREVVPRVPDAGDGFVVVATGPLTSPALEKALLEILGEKYLYFYDSVAPIVEASSLDMSRLYALSRWGKGGGDDYLNVPLTKAEYETFVGELVAGEKVPFRHPRGRLLRRLPPPSRPWPAGVETLLLTHEAPWPRGPETGKGLRRASSSDGRSLKEHFSPLGFRTKLKVGEQRGLPDAPGPRNASCALRKLQPLHQRARAPRPVLRWKKDRASFAGQLTGVEGYLESAATGLMVGDARAPRGREPEPLPFSTALGSLARHVSDRKGKDISPRT